MSSSIAAAIDPWDAVLLCGLVIAGLVLIGAVLYGISQDRQTSVVLGSVLDRSVKYQNLASAVGYRAESGDIV